MNKQLKMGIILQYVQMALSIVISLAYTPFMLKILGQTQYGLYNLASSIISYLSLLSLGFGSSYVRYYCIKKKNEPEKIKSLNGLYIFVFTIIGLIALVCGLIISQNVSIFLNETYTSNDIETAKILTLLLTFNLSLSFPMSVFSSYVTSQEKFIFQKLLNMGKTVFSPALSIIALFLGYGSIGLVLTSTLISLLIDFFNIFYCFKKLKMEISFKNLEFILVKEIFVFSIFIAINQIVDQINWQTDKIILGKMINGAAVSIYAIGSTMNTHFTHFSTAVSSVFAPRVNKIVQKNDENMDEQLTQLMTSVGRIQFMILYLILTGFIFFGKFFILKWAGDGYEESYFVALLLMSPAIVPLIQNVGIEIQRAKNKHQFRSIAYLIMAVINVILSIILCKFYGIIGVTIGTTISLLICNGLIMNIFYHKVIKLDMIYFWKEILKLFAVFLIPTGVGVFFMFLQIDTLGKFFGGIAIYVVVYLFFLIMFGLNKNEKGALWKIIKKK